MKKRSQYIMKIAVGLTILLGVLAILITNEKSFKKIVADDVENISRLSSSIIYSEIDNSLTKPIFVGLTMANDYFLKNWLSAEPQSGGNEKQNLDMQQYLSEYCKKYGYDVVMVASAKSEVYYYQDGINKVMSRSNAHDVWYYDFVESEKQYDLDVDTDEVNNDELTVFANCRIVDDKGKLMGVVGIGIKMDNLQQLLAKYESQYDLKACLMNDDGLVQVDTIDENIENLNFFSKPHMMQFKEKIIDNKNSMDTFWYANDESDHCLITQYVDNLDWYIVIEKNTEATQKVLVEQINRDLLLITLIIVIVLLMISYVLSKYNRMLLKTASVDDVTNLPNSRMFQEIFARNTKRPACKEGLVFVFDIDKFKNINDKFGHLFGNTILYRISETAKNILGSKGVVARWGGDEFAGVIYCDEAEGMDILEKMVVEIAALHEGDLEDATVSLGTTIIKPNTSLNSMLKEADTAMYHAKGNGGNQITTFKSI